MPAITLPDGRTVTPEEYQRIFGETAPLPAQDSSWTPEGIMRAAGAIPVEDGTYLVPVPNGDGTTSVVPAGSAEAAGAVGAGEGATGAACVGVAGVTGATGVAGAVYPAAGAVGATGAGFLGIEKPPSNAFEDLSPPILLLISIVFLTSRIPSITDSYNNL